MYVVCSLPLQIFRKGSGECCNEVAVTHKTKTASYLRGQQQCRKLCSSCWATVSCSCWRIRAYRTTHSTALCRVLRTLAQVKAVQEYLKELLENTDQKLLVFAHHKDLLDGVEFIMNKCAAAWQLIS